MQTDSGSLRELVARNVRAARVTRGLSQEAFADLCGYHRTYIGSIERGQRNITLETLEALAAALDITPQSLMAQ